MAVSGAEAKTELADAAAAASVALMIDAGLRPRDHYRIRLGNGVRQKLRNALLVLVRQETAILAQIQGSVRCTVGDIFFSYTAVTGSHTFFMLFLPILTWNGHVRESGALVDLLAAGVAITGVMKDYFCLPRPLSPPLHRLTLSGSAALEYGFPSTHSANAVSTAMFLMALVHERYGGSDTRTVSLIACIYAASVVLGRIYCGMHGFTDVAFGCVLGYAIYWVRWTYKAAFDSLNLDPSWTGFLAMTLLLLLVISMHPEPADPCPCFDDTVAFIAVKIGFALAALVFPGSTGVGKEGDPFFTWTLIPKIVIGLAVIVGWRALAKKVLLRSLPPVFRYLSRFNMLLPRFGYLSAGQYTQVPDVKDDTLGELSNFPAIIGRRRSDSVGPQSPADYFESMAQKSRQHALNKYAQQNGTPPSEEMTRTNSDALLFKLPEPLVRYDVEIVTKLIVYSGISFFSLGIIPKIFRIVGLA